MIRYSKYCLLWLLVFILNSCVDPFDLDGEIENVDSILVVEATITNELEQHQVLLSRTFNLNAEPPPPPVFGLDQSGSAPETNATVTVVDNLQNEFTFSEANEGTYISDIAFSAEPERSYQLFIRTSEGEEYTSVEVNLLPTSSQIENISANLAVNNEGVKE